jgi:uncharacterized RDD family membrane protein YckC
MKRHVGPAPALPAGGLSEMSLPGLGGLIGASGPHVLPRFPARAWLRLAAYVLEVVPLLVILRFTYLSVPWLGFLGLLLGCVALGHSTPGLRVLHMRLDARQGGRAARGQTLLRLGLQHGWLLFLALFIGGAYGGSPLTEVYGLIALSLGTIAMLGSVGALFGRKQALHDRLSGTYVVVDRS